MTALLEAMVQLLAPILTFTAEEVWQALPAYPGKAESVHLTQFPEVNENYLQPDLAETWKTLIAVKGEVAKAIETARQNKVLGHSLDAAVVIAAPEDLRATLERHREDLRTLLIVSDVRFADAQATGDAYRSTEVPGLAVSVGRAEGAKCNRCWIYSETVGSSEEHPTICARCRDNL
jgi:isoleucyl-tRNA synthetase